MANLAYENNVNSYKVQAILFNNTQWQDDMLPAPRIAAPLSTDALTTVVSWAASHLKAHTQPCCMSVSTCMSTYQPSTSSSCSDSFTSL